MATPIGGHKSSKAQRRVGRKTVSRVSKRHGLSGATRKTAKQKAVAKIRKKKATGQWAGMSDKKMAQKSRKIARRTTRKVAARRGKNIVPPSKPKPKKGK